MSEERQDTRFTVGKYYTICHSRKGTFTIKVLSNRNQQITGKIINGKTTAMMDYNVREAGEEIIIRTSFITSYSEIKIAK